MADQSMVINEIMGLQRRIVNLTLILKKMYIQCSENLRLLERAKMQNSQTLVRAFTARIEYLRVEMRLNATDLKRYTRAFINLCLVPEDLLIVYPSLMHGLNLNVEEDLPPQPID